MLKLSVAWMPSRQTEADFVFVFVLFLIGRFDGDSGGKCAAGECAHWLVGWFGGKKKEEKTRPDSGRNFADIIWGGGISGVLSDLGFTIYMNIH